MSLPATMGLVCFGVLALVFGYVALKGRAGSLLPGSPLGLRDRELAASDETWTEGHRAAWPILAMASGISAFHALGCGFVLGGLLGEDGGAMLLPLLVAGVVIVVALRFVASTAAVAAVRSAGE